MEQLFQRGLSTSTVGQKPQSRKWLSEIKREKAASERQKMAAERVNISVNLDRHSWL